MTALESVVIEAERVTGGVEHDAEVVRVAVRWLGHRFGRLRAASAKPTASPTSVTATSRWAILVGRPGRSGHTGDSYQVSDCTLIVAPPAGLGRCAQWSPSWVHTAGSVQPAATDRPRSRL